MCETLDTIILCTFIKNEQVHLLMMGLTIIAYAWKKKRRKVGINKETKVFGSFFICHKHWQERR